MSAIAGSPRSSPFSYVIDEHYHKLRASEEKFVQKQEQGIHTAEAPNEHEDRADQIPQAPDGDMSLLPFVYDFAANMERHYAPWRADINETMMCSVIDRLVEGDSQVELSYKLFDCSGIMPPLKLKNATVFYRELFLISRYVKRQGSLKRVSPRQLYQEWNQFVNQLCTTKPEKYFKQYYECERKFLYSTIDGLMIRMHLVCSRLVCNDPSACGNKCSTCRLQTKCAVLTNCPLCHSTSPKMTKEERRSHKLPELLRVMISLLDAQTQRKIQRVIESKFERLTSHVRALQECIFELDGIVKGTKRQRTTQIDFAI